MEPASPLIYHFVLPLPAVATQPVLYGSVSLGENVVVEGYHKLSPGIKVKVADAIVEEEKE